VVGKNNPKSRGREKRRLPGMDSNTTGKRQKKAGLRQAYISASKERESLGEIASNPA